VKQTIDKLSDRDALRFEFCFQLFERSRDPQRELKNMLLWRKSSGMHIPGKSPNAPKYKSAYFAAAGEERRILLKLANPQ